MGCNIHTVIERKRLGDMKWTGIVSSDALPKRPIYAQRDYDFFGEIANVRRSGSNYPKNLPEDISELAWQEYMSAPRDHHSASYMSLDEFCSIHNKINPEQSRREHCVYDLAGWVGEDDSAELRVVFWFDN